MEQDKLALILRAAQCGPSAGDLQAWRVHVVERESVGSSGFDRIYPCSRWAARVPCMLVFCALREASAQRYRSRGRKLYAVQDATIAATLAVMQATELGLATCWLGAFDVDHTMELLGLRDKSSEEPVAVIALGYEEAPPDKAPARPRKRRRVDIVWPTK